MAENYVTNQYSFESRESYEQTKKEAEQIKKLIHSADLKNPKIALKIYNKCVSDKMFHTMAGYNFLMELRHFIGKDTTYDTSKTSLLLNGTGINCPPVDEHMIAAYLRYFKKLGCI